MAGLPFGTLKRVELARALGSEPRLLLLDEPAGGLNHEEVSELGAFITKMRDDFDLTVLLVEHHMGLVMGIAERIHVLDFGRKIAEGTPDRGAARLGGDRGVPRRGHRCCVSRDLEWEGCLNVRDLGGLALEDGGETRYGALVRADNIRQLTDDGWRSLAEHGVARIVDLRWPEELDEDPPRDVDIDVVHVSLLGELDPNFSDDVRDYMAVDDPAGYWAISYTRILHAFAPNFARRARSDRRRSRRGGRVPLRRRQGPHRPRRCARCCDSPARRSRRSRSTTR